MDIFSEEHASSDLSVEISVSAFESFSWSESRVADCDEISEERSWILAVAASSSSSLCRDLIF